MRWEIHPRSRFCCRCGREFLHGDRYRCVLSYCDEEPVRRDFCEGCWDSQPQFQRPEEELISWWQSTVRIPPPKPKEEAIKRSAAEQLLRKYVVFPERKYVNFCHILGLMLERRRVLSEKHTIREEPNRGRDKTIIVYEHNKTGETFLIEDPHLTLSQIDEVQTQLKEILDSEQKERRAEEKQEEMGQPLRTGEETQEESGK